jgi:hypothetical protein
VGNADTLWAKVFGPNNQLATSRSVAIDGSGNVVVGGDFEQAIDLGGGMLTTPGAFVAKYGPTGSFQWNVAFGTSGSTSSMAGVVVDATGAVYVTGAFSGTINCGGGTLTDPGMASDAIFVAKLDAGGHLVWSKAFGDGTHQASVDTMAVTPNGVLLTGTYYATVSFGGPALTPGAGATTADFVVALDAGGNQVWSKSLPSTTNLAAAVDGGGNVALAGTFATPTIDFGGGPLTAVGGADLVVAKLNSSGTYVWGKDFGSSSDDGASAVAFDGGGDLVLVGFASAAINFGGGPLAAGSFVAKLDGGGGHVWSKAFTGNAQAETVAADSSGVFLAGFALGTIGIGGTQLPQSTAGIDLLVIKLDPTGNYVWGRRAGDGASASAQQISVNAAHASAIAGSTRNGSINLGTGGLPCSGMCGMVAEFGP